jgi:hypothetical protein
VEASRLPIVSRHRRHGGPNWDGGSKDVDRDGGFAHDDADLFAASRTGHDGTSGLRQGYAWDAENRLIAVAPRMVQLFGRPQIVRPAWFRATVNDESRPRHDLPCATKPCRRVPEAKGTAAESRSRRAAVVVAQHPAEPLAADDFAFLAADLFAWLDQPVLQVLMIPLAVIVLAERVDGLA